MNFEIDPAYLTSEMVTKTHRPHANKGTVTPDELIEVLSHNSTVTSTWSQDHPQFTQLREHLESTGYITCERRWWNGDRVRRAFAVNGHEFDVNDSFPCACALGIQIQVRQRMSSCNQTQPSTTSTDTR